MQLSCQSSEALQEAGLHGLPRSMYVPDVIRGRSHSRNVVTKNFATAVRFNIVNSDHDSATYLTAERLVDPGVLAEEPCMNFSVSATDHLAAQAIQPSPSEQRVF